MKTKTVVKPAGSKDRVLLLEDLLKKARDPGSTKTELRKIWNSTKSCKIRREIASNPNADVDIMKMSARLYLKEVLNNPTFELIELFEDDPFVKAIQEVYKNPRSVHNARSGVSYKDMDLVTRTALLSPHLNLDIFLDCTRRLPTEVIKRELRDKDVYNRVQSLVVSRFSSIKINSSSVCLDEIFRGRYSSERSVDAVTFFNLYALGMISEDEVNKLIYLNGVSRSHPFSKEIYKYVMDNLTSDSMTQSKIDNATRTLLITTRNSVSKLEKKLFSSKEDERITLLTSLVGVFNNIVDLGSTRKWDNVGWEYWNRARKIHGLITLGTIFHCTGKQKAKEFKNVPQHVFEKVYETFDLIGFKDLASTFDNRAFRVSDPFSTQSLNNCSKEAREFFVLNGFLTDNLIISDLNKNLVGLLNHLNESAGIEGAIYKYSRLNYYKEIEYNHALLKKRAVYYMGIDSRRIAMMSTSNGSDLNYYFPEIRVAGDYIPTTQFVYNLLNPKTDRTPV